MFTYKNFILWLTISRSWFQASRLPMILPKENMADDLLTVRPLGAIVPV